jgi:hypothetical protein
MLKAHIKDGKGGSYEATVSKYGELITSRFDYSVPVCIDLTVDDQVYNFIEPKADNRIVLTDIMMYADRNVGVNDAAVSIWGSTIGPSSATAAEVYLNAEIPQKTARDLIGLNIITKPGVWVNASTNDNTVFMTLNYYYIKEL